MRLFKYLHPDRINVLQNTSIRFTQPQYLNDPFEQLPFISSITTPERFDSIIETLRQKLSSHATLNQLDENDLYEIIRPLPLNESERLKIIHIFKQLPDFFNAYGSEILDDSENLNQLREVLCNPISPTTYSQQIKALLNQWVGLLCLTQSNDNLLMWSHYADGGKGYVIEFDPLHPFFKNSGYLIKKLDWLQKVKYPSKRPALVLFDRKRGMLDYLSSTIFLTKNRDWKYEKEIRLIRNLKEAYECVLHPTFGPIYLFRFDPSAILRVYLGVNVTPESEAKIVTILKEERYAHVELYKATLNPKEYTLDFEPFRQL